jgi:iron-sulfur cluster repair protein YtfE (RIC family)
MRFTNYDQQTVNEFSNKVAGAREILRSSRIDANMRGYSLANAAAASGTTTDDLRARMDYRLRRSSQHVAHEEAELVV